MSFESLHFAVGLFGVSMLAAAVLPLATSYSLTEAFGLKRGVDKRLRDAAVFWPIFNRGHRKGYESHRWHGYCSYKGRERKQASWSRQ